MAALLTICYWLFIVAVIPGLMAMATIGCGLAVVDPDRAWIMAAHLSDLGEWMLLPIVLTVIVVNQSIGILIEELLIQLRLLGGRGAGAHKDRRYRQYTKLYLVLASMTEEHDTHGHIRRAVTQFFLTINSLFPFVAGGATALVVASMAEADTRQTWAWAGAYCAAMFACLLVTSVVAVIRFWVMVVSVATVERVMRRAGNSPVGAEKIFDDRVPG